MLVENGLEASHTCSGVQCLLDCFNTYSSQVGNAIYWFRNIYLLLEFGDKFVRQVVRSFLLNEFSQIGHKLLHNLSLYLSFLVAELQLKILTNLSDHFFLVITLFEHSLDLIMAPAEITPRHLLVHISQLGDGLFQSAQLCTHLGKAGHL